MPGPLYNSFSVDLTKFADKAKNRMGAFLREFSQDLALQIIQDTPVDTGFARASWYSAINQITADYIPAPSGSSSAGQATYADMGSVLNNVTLNMATAQAGDIVYILNNCRYINVLEDGYGDRPARNFVKGALSRAEVIAHDVLKRIGAE